MVVLKSEVKEVMLEKCQKDELLVCDAVSVFTEVSMYAGLSLSIDTTSL